MPGNSRDRGCWDISFRRRYLGSHSNWRSFRLYRWSFRGWGGSWDPFLRLHRFGRVLFHCAGVWKIFWCRFSIHPGETVGRGFHLLDWNRSSGGRDRFVRGYIFHPGRCRQYILCGGLCRRGRKHPALRTLLRFRPGRGWGGLSFLAGKHASSGGHKVPCWFPGLPRCGGCDLLLWFGWFRFGQFRRGRPFQLVRVHLRSAVGAFTCVLRDGISA